jgi:hypothetical protein
MHVRYTSGKCYYACSAQAVNYGGPHCQSLSARAVDERVSQLVLLALQHSSLEVSLRVAQDLAAERARLEVTWQKQLERAQYEVDRALRQYNIVEPENRLVARTMEKQLEQRLSEQRALQQEYARILAQQPAALTEAEQEAIRILAQDIPSLWAAPTTTTADRQQIIRQMVEKIIVTVHGHTEQVAVQVQWAGGHKTETSVTRPVARLQQLSYYPALMERVQNLRQQGLTAEQTAQQLNDEGWRPAKRRTTWNADMVLHLWASLRRPRSRDSEDDSGEKPKSTSTWTLPELARHLDMPVVTLYSWLRRGWIQGRQNDDPHCTWLVDADPPELSRLRALRNAKKHGSSHNPAGTSPLPRA